MLENPSKAYDDFWNRLLPAYPISKGALRLPIASNAIEIPHLNYEKFINNLVALLEQIITKHALKSKAKKRAREAGDHHLLPLIDDDFTGVVRFDCLWNPVTKHMSVIELNADYPDGLLLHDKTYGTLVNQNISTHESLLNSLFNKEQTVVLHDPKSEFLDAYAVEADNLRTLGLGGSRVTNVSAIGADTTIRRCVETTKMNAHTIDMLIRTKPKMINSIALRTLGYKDILGTIDHPYILQTHNVCAKNMTYCQDNREHLVLKPANGCEGFGIYFGKEFTEVTWSKKLKSVVNQNYLVQELAHVPQMHIGLFESGTVMQKFLYYDLCPHFFVKSGKIIGNGLTLMRFSEKQIVNVSQGGGIGYYKL